MVSHKNRITVAEAYLHTLISASGEDLVRLVGADASIDDPHLGSISQPDRIIEFSRNFKDWLAEAELETERLRTTAADGQVCCEDILHIRGPQGYLQLPVGTVVSSAIDTGANIIHVYYTQWPFYQRHSVRPALYTESQTLEHHRDVIHAYFEGLASGDLEQTLNCFEADIYFREASGPPYVHWGTNAVRKYFQGLFKKGAPMLRDDTIIDDGRCAVMEFTVIGWNGIERDPQQYEAGLAVYQRSSDGLISAIRIYDDVDFQ